MTDTPIDYSDTITRLYQGVQFRDPPAQDLAKYNTALQAKTMTMGQLETIVMNDPFTLNVVNPIIRLYEAAFDRLPDQEGLRFWSNLLASNPNAMPEIGAFFANTQDFKARFDANATTTANADLVTKMYEKILGHEPDPAGLAFWVGTGLNAGQLLQAFAEVPQFKADKAPTVYAFEGAEIADAVYWASHGGQYNYAGTTGNDTFTFQYGNPTIVTNGGGDLITVGGFDQTLGFVTGSLVVDFFTGTGPFSLNPMPGSITSAFDLAQPGYWGLPAGASPASPASLLANGTGTSADQTVVTVLPPDSVTVYPGNYPPNGPEILLFFSAQAFTREGGNLGLVTGDLHTSPISVLGSAPTTVLSGGTVPAKAWLIVLTGATFSDANALAHALTSGSFALNFAAPGVNGDTAHILFAYDDSHGNAHVADVAITESASASASAQNHLVASDMVEVMGVSASTLAAHNIGLG